MVRELVRLLVASLAFALYVTCPRMTAMIASQARVARIDPVAVIVLGCLLGIPFFVALLYTLKYVGLEAAILVAAAFDVGAAVLLGELDLKLGLELAVITVFVYVGIRAAPMIADALLRLVSSR